MTVQTKKNSLFWLGFFVALVLVVGLIVYYYKDNKNKKLKDIKIQIENFIKSKLSSPSSPKNIKVRIKRLPKKPKKFIVKK